MHDYTAFRPNPNPNPNPNPRINTYGTLNHWPNRIKSNKGFFMDSNQIKLSN